MYDSSHLEINEHSLVNTKLNISIPKDRLHEIGHLGCVLADIGDAINRLKKLELTDVELSLLAALVLFCPGKFDIQLAKKRTKVVSFYKLSETGMTSLIL